ncbi:MAG: T9SS type A sorting domain-containing protein [Flavobacteriales bacterium]
MPSSKKAGMCLIGFLLFALPPAYAQQPGGVSTNLRAWFKADANAYYTTSPLALCTNSQVVTQWRDQTANALHLGQTTTAQKPTWSNGSSAAYQNYNPSIKFTNNYLFRAAPGILANGATYDKLNLYVVYYDYDAADFDWLFYAGGTSGLDRLSVSMNYGGAASLDCDVPATYNRVTASTSTELPAGRTNILAVKADNTGIYGGGEANKVQYFANGTAGAAKTTRTSITHSNQPTQIGDNELATGDAPNNPFTGELAELFLYTGSISQVQHQRIESYLALKYAVTIGHDLFASTGTNIFSRTGAYTNNIIGIGSDSGSGLVQKQSRQADDSTRIFIASLAATNAANTGTFSSSGQFVVIGQNGGKMRSATGTGSERPSGILSRIDREWKVTNTAFPGTFGLNFKLNTTPITANDLRLLVDDDGDFTDAKVYSLANGLTITYTSGVVSITGITNAMVPQNSTRYFTIGSVNAGTPLPVELLFFDAQPVGSSAVQLAWATASERDNDHFDVERSTDGRTFMRIVTVVGNGTSMQRIDYGLRDEQPQPGINYYRLKQVDVDGAFVHSEVRPVSIPMNAGTLSVVPNPARDVARLSGLTAEEAVDVRLFDVAGRPVPMPPVADGLLDLAALPSGLYVLRAGDRMARILKE